VWLVDTLYSIFKFAIALRQSFGDDIRATGQMKRVLKKYSLSDLEFMFGIGRFAQGNSAEQQFYFNIERGVSTRSDHQPAAVRSSMRQAFSSETALDDDPTLSRK
jgi:hypothetical protein